jgi:hypothetical protein
MINHYYDVCMNDNCCQVRPFTAPSRSPNTTGSELTLDVQLMLLIIDQMNNNTAQDGAHLLLPHVHVCCARDASSLLAMQAMQHARAMVPLVVLTGPKRNTGLHIPEYMQYLHIQQQARVAAC